MINFGKLKKTNISIYGSVQSLNIKRKDNCWHSESNHIHQNAIYVNLTKRYV